MYSAAYPTDAVLWVSYDALSTAPSLSLILRYFYDISTIFLFDTTGHLSLEELSHILRDVKTHDYFYFFLILAVVQSRCLGLGA